jgi:hypothetical protein
MSSVTAKEVASLLRSQAPDWDVCAVIRQIARAARVCEIGRRTYIRRHHHFFETGTPS